MSTMQTAPLRLKHRRASEGLLKNTSTTTTRFMSEFGDAAQQPLSNPRTHEMRTLLIDSMQHNTKRGAVLPTRQPRNGHTLTTNTTSANNSSAETIGELPSSSSSSAVNSAVNPEFSSLLGNLQAKKKSLHGYERNGGSSHIPASIASISNAPMSARAAANMVNASSNSSINQALCSSTSSQQLANSAFATSSSTHTSHATSSSSSSSHVHMSSKEIKEQPLYRDIANMKSSMAEMKSLATYTKLRSSMENILDTEQKVTFPDDDSDDATERDVMSPCSELMMPVGSQICRAAGAGDSLLAGGDTVTFQEKRTTSASKHKVTTDGFSSEQATSNSSEMKHLQAGDVDYREETAAAAVRKKIEVDGITAEQNAAAIKEARTFKSGDIQQQETNNRAATHTSIHSDSFSAQNSARAQSQQRQTVTAGGHFNQEQNYNSSSQSSFSMSSRGISTAGAAGMIGAANQMKAMSGMLNEMMPCFDDLERLSSTTDVEAAIQKYGQILNVNVNSMKEGGSEPVDGAGAVQPVPDVLNSINQVIQRAWSVPTYGHQLGYGLCNTLRESGGLDLLVSNCVGQDHELQFSSARLLEQCLTTENRSHVVEHGLEKVVNVACFCTNNKNTKEPDHSRVGTGILEHLFKHSEDTCSDVINLGGLDAVLFECRKNDVETLRHCAMALANLSLYGGAENQAAMINRKVPMWLFPLAFHDDDNIKYYACLAIAVLVANKEIEAEVLKSGTLDLVEPFVMTHNPSEFAKSNLAHAHGQSKQWLKRLVPVLSSNREEARNLAAFHFCMEAGIKKEQQLTDIFREIGAVEPLKVVASCPNAVASKFAAQALRLMGEEVPHKLSQQVPLWSVEDVREWVKQIGFAGYEQDFSESRVDGDLLLQLSDENIRDDIGIRNGIHRQRFRRELESLMKMADYSSKDAACLNAVLQNIGPEFSIYTYPMLNAGVDKEALRTITESQLINECGITNSIHRMRILNSTKSEATFEPPSSMEKTLDVFVSYRRSNGSQLASLLKVHLQLRGFTVFIDVERLEAGKFDINLLNSIKQAKHFILVLTPNTLDRCINDTDCNDWVHREIVAALTSGCNIIPIIDNFSWPEVEVLPDDMRTVCHFNAVRWIHDYQDACVDKLERFMRGERDAAIAPNMFRGAGGGVGGGGGSGSMPPSTPSTYASQRTNPLSFQRLNSCESDSTGPASIGSGGGRVSD